MTQSRIPFNRAYMTGQELENISQAAERGTLSGNGHFSHACEKWLEEYGPTDRALLTHSCTGALEMAAILLNLQSGDEVIMPAYTFVSTANAVALRGAIPIFADIRPDTLNIDETKIEALITPRTKSIWVVHYAGVACDMDSINQIAKKHNLSVVEDAAQGILSTYKGHALGTIGDMGTLSFHETKNVTCGEGGALFVNQTCLIDRAEIIHEKGTNRREFAKGKVDKYTWHDIGSSYLLGELAAAFLFAQLKQAREITDKRLSIWDAYHRRFAELETQGRLQRPTIPKDCEHNAHMYYILLSDAAHRPTFLENLAKKDICAVFHYVPLDIAPASKKLSRPGPPLDVTHDLANRIVRLPIWAGLPTESVDYIADSVTTLLS